MLEYYMRKAQNKLFLGVRKSYEMIDIATK